MSANWFPSDEYVAGLFDGEGSISRQNGQTGRGYNRTYLVFRIGNNDDRVLKHIHSRFGGAVRSYKRPRPHYCFEIGERDDATRFLSALVPHLAIKRNLAWIVLCFLERGMRNWQGKRVPASELEMRAMVADLIKKINSRKGKPVASAFCALSWRKAGAGTRIVASDSGAHMLR